MTRILISTSSFGRVSSEPLQALEGAGYECRLNPHGRTLEPQEVLELVQGCDGLIAGTERLERDTLAGARDLRVISRLGAGIENVDLLAAEELGIRVTSTPDPPAKAVAELALGGLLAVLRHLCSADRELRARRWRKPMGRLLAGKTVGIVGTGRAGRSLVELLAPFDCQLLACDLELDLRWAERHQVEYRELDPLLGASDVVSLHVPLTNETRHLLDRGRLDRMKNGAILINCARGGLVDEAALADNLRSGKLEGAFLDVFEIEPYEGELIGVPNTLLTPHIGSYAAECRLEMENQAVENLIGALSAPGSRR